MPLQKRNHSLAIFGTASDVGKSVTATALCRIFRDYGLKTAPFKAQNMSNNSYVSLTQGEMSRAQAVQAEAAGIEPTVDMNPVLLKPSSDLVSQVIVHGKVAGNRSAADYFSNTTSFFQESKTSLDRLRAQYEMIVIEGAGSCAEVNLRSKDFTNFEIAHHVDAPVLLVGDIDRGGVFAQIVGTLEVLPPHDRERIKGIIINRFRGDAKLFDDGIQYLEERTKLPVLGLIPHFSDIQIDSEDGLSHQAKIDPALEATDENSEPIKIGVILLPHISNFTDFAPLEIPGIAQVHYLRRPRILSAYDQILIPGSKNVRGDLEWIHESGWSKRIKDYQTQGGRIGGICGGYQILGQKVCDPHGIEGPWGESIGLQMLPVETTLHRIKTLHQTKATWRPTGGALQGYEIHHGITSPLEEVSPLLTIHSRDGHKTETIDGTCSQDGKIWGCYLHGLFDSPDFRRDFLRSISQGKVDLSQLSKESPFEFRQRQYDLLAEHFKKHLDMRKLLAISLNSTAKGSIS